MNNFKSLSKDEIINVNGGWNPFNIVKDIDYIYVAIKKEFCAFKEGWDAYGRKHS